MLIDLVKRVTIHVKITNSEIRLNKICLRCLRFSVRKWIFDLIFQCENKSFPSSSFFFLSSILRTRLLRTIWAQSWWYPYVVTAKKVWTSNCLHMVASSTVGEMCWSKCPLLIQARANHIRSCFCTPTGIPSCD